MRVMLRSVALIICLSVALTCIPAASAQAAQTKQPNVILLLAEDMGYGDLSTFGHPYARTPNLDRLAAEGTQFQNFHVAGATCSPSRMGLMTGRIPSSVPNFMADFGYQGLLTATELFKDAGYRTAHVGKWHMGPNEDEVGVYGIDQKRLVGTSMRNEEGKDFEVYESAINFIKQNANNDADEPFYMNVWGHIAHSPVKPPQNLIDLFNDVVVNPDDFSIHYQDKIEQARRIALANGRNLNVAMRSYLADVWALDLQIGKLLQTVDDLGLRDNTIIAFLSDHGAASVNEGVQAMPENMMGYGGPFRGYKGTFLEGSLRVPHIVRWPGRIPAGKVNDNTLMSALDWVPTSCSAAGVPFDPTMFDGKDMSDVWFGTDRSRVEGPLYWKKHVAEGEIAMIYDQWKLAYTGPVTDTFVLYDLENDPDEEINLMDTENLATGGAKRRNYISKSLTPVLMEQLKSWNKTTPVEHCQVYAYESCTTPLPFNPNKAPADVVILQLPIPPWEEDDSTTVAVETDGETDGSGSDGSGSDSLSPTPTTPAPSEPTDGGAASDSLKPTAKPTKRPKPTAGPTTAVAAGVESETDGSGFGSGSGSGPGSNSTVPTTNSPVPTTNSSVPTANSSAPTTVPQTSLALDSNNSSETPVPSPTSLPTPTPGSTSAAAGTRAPFSKASFRAVVAGGAYFGLMLFGSS